MPHSMRDHAVLSASGADRWLKCTPAPRLEDTVADVSSTYADEGTKAHELGEYRIAERMGWEIDPERLKVIQSSEYYNQDMEDFVGIYVDAVMEKYHAALAVDPTAKMLLERRLNFSEWVPEGFGTGDVLIINMEKIVVIDLKFGKGVIVSAVENPQMMLYALGAYHGYGLLYDFEKIEVSIIQPRLDAQSDWEIDVDALLRWGDREVRHKAALAWAGEGDFVAGEHCKFCRVRSTCRARAEKNLELVRMEFRMPPLLTLDEVGAIMQEAQKLANWSKDIKEWAEEQAITHGVHIPGWKVVAGRSNRTFSDDIAVQSTLDLEGYALDDVAPRKLLGITAMEKLVGKKLLEGVLGGLIIKPEGKPVLCIESDKRPEWNPAAAAFSPIE